MKPRLRVAADFKLRGCRFAGAVDIVNEVLLAFPAVVAGETTINTTKQS
jgi:hypothetical protein